MLPNGWGLSPMRYARMYALQVLNRPTYVEFSFRTAVVWISEYGPADYASGSRCGTLKVNLDTPLHIIKCNGLRGRYVTVQMVEHNLKRDQGEDWSYDSKPYLGLAGIKAYAAA